MLHLFRLVIAFVCASAFFAVSAEAKRVAFVVGNADYNSLVPLENPQRDAAAVADRLKDLGFKVTELFNSDAFSLNRAAKSFVAEAKDADLALFYFAGHGVQLFDRNFLLARDADPKSVSRPQDLGLDLSTFMEALRNSGAVRLALLIDACRDNPLSFEETVRVLDRLRTDTAFKSASTTAGRSTRGLARVDFGAGGQVAKSTAQTLLFFAAQPGAVSFDGAGLNSYYVEGLKEQLAKPDRGFSEILRAVSAYVRTVTDNQQVPQIVSDWTDDVAMGASTPAARIEYQVYTSGSKALTPAERNLVMRSASGYSKFRGDFIAKASISSEPNYNLTEDEKKQVGKLGHAGSLSISYDLDRDGRDETLHIRPRPQVGGYVLDVEVDGVRAEVSNCLVDAEHVEIALRDINGDRRPEVWIAYDTEKIPGWGRFCILEYRGLPKLAELRRGNTGKVSAGYAAFRTLLRGESGWHLTVATDNAVKACGGSNCHTVWVYSFDGRQFRLLDDGSQAPQGARALPFEDESERSAKLFAGLAKAARPQTPTGWRVAQRSTNVIAALARIGARTEISFECSYLPGLGKIESIVVRDLASAGPASDAEVREEERLTYGEILASSPMLVDGNACVLGGVGSYENLGIRLSPVFGPEGSCWEKLFNATMITLPIVWKNTALLQLRMVDAAPFLGAARRACIGDRTALTEPPIKHSIAPTISSTEDMRMRVAQFIAERYFQYGSGGVGEIGQLLAASVDYYGKQRTRDEVVHDKLRYYAKWPDRTYTLMPETLSVNPAPGLPGRWNAEFQYTFRVSGQKDVRSGRGVARLGLVPAAGRGFLIAAESGEVLERY